MMGSVLFLPIDAIGVSTVTQHVLQPSIRLLHRLQLRLIDLSLCQLLNRDIHPAPHQRRYRNSASSHCSPNYTNHSCRNAAVGKYRTIGSPGIRNPPDGLSSDGEQPRDDADCGDNVYACSAYKRRDRSGARYGHDHSDGHHVGLLGCAPL